MCIAKGKEHRNIEFGSKVGLIVTRKNGLFVSAVNFSDNRYDGKTTEELMEVQGNILGFRCAKLVGDRGFRGRKYFDKTEVLTPTPPTLKQSSYQKKKLRDFFRSRAGIEPRIKHLINHFTLNRNFLKGVVGDNINLLLACSAFNFKKRLTELKIIFFVYWIRFRNREVFDSRLIFFK